jgi:hypothetical protein
MVTKQFEYEVKRKNLQHESCETFSGDDYSYIELSTPISYVTMTQGYPRPKIASLKPESGLRDWHQLLPYLMNSTMDLYLWDWGGSRGAHESLDQRDLNDKDKM